MICHTATTGKRKDRERNKGRAREDGTAKRQTQQRLCTFRSLQGERAWERNGLDYYRTGEHRHSTTVPQGAPSAGADEKKKKREKNSDGRDRPTKTRGPTPKKRELEVRPAPSMPPPPATRAGTNSAARDGGTSDGGAANRPGASLAPLEYGLCENSAPSEAPAEGSVNRLARKPPANEA